MRRELLQSERARRRFKERSKFVVAETIVSIRSLRLSSKKGTARLDHIRRVDHVAFVREELSPGEPD